MSKTSTRLERWQLLLCALMAAAVLAAFAPALDVFLAGDDFEWLQASYDLVGNPMSGFALINHFFRPLIKWTYLADYLVFGQLGAGYAATNLLIHFFNSAALFLLMRRRGVTQLVAAWAAAAFALSPLHSEAVLWAAGRPDTVLLSCWLVALLLLDRWCEDGGPGWAVAFTVAALLGIGAKESWIVFPFLASAYLIWVRRESVVSSLGRTAVIWAAWSAYLVVFILVPALNGRTTATHYADFSLSDALVKTGNTLLGYCTFGLFPAVGAVGALLAGAVIGGAAVALMRGGNRFGGWALLWLASTLALTAPFPLNVLRHNYLPLAGFWMLVATVVDRSPVGVGDGASRRGRAGAVLALLAVLGVIPLEGWLLQREIADYRLYGDLHSRLYQRFAAIEDRIPRDRPLVLINRGTLRGVEIVASSVQGVDKTFFVRSEALWQLVFLPPLANFAGRPFDERLVRVDPATPGLLENGCSVLLFNDAGFQLRPDLERPVLAALTAGDDNLLPGARVFRYQPRR